MKKINHFIEHIIHLKKTDYIKIIGLFFIWRIYLFTAYAIGNFFLSFNKSFPYSEEMLRNSGLPLFIQSFANFDGVHYLILAKYGYGPVGFEEVFFPLFPALLYLSGNITASPLLSGLILTNLIFLFALFILFFWVKHRYGVSTAWWTILFLLSFPTSFFFGSLYTESLFFLLTLLIFLFFEKNQYLWVGLIGAAASATRLAGILFAPSLLFATFKKKKGIFKVVVLSLTWVGFLFYISYLAIHFHNPFAFLTAQAAFKNARATNFSSLVFLPQVFYRYARIFVTVPITQYSFWIAAFEVEAFILPLILLYKGLRMKLFSSSILLFSFFSLLLPTLSGTLSSMPRYVLPLFPLYIILATIRKRWIKIFIIFSSFILLGVLTALFTHGYWVS